MEGRKRVQRGRRSPDAPAAGDARRAAGAPQWETHEESLAFPADAPPRPAAQRGFALPASGTAEEILGREALRELEAVALGPALAEAPPPRAAPTARAALTFFGATQAREQPEAAVPTEHLATFFLDREEYGVEVRLVQEIIRPSEITPVPRAPEFVRGVINLRGRIVPVIDLKRKLGLGPLVPGRATRIVVCRLGERLIGALVDAASQVLKVPLTAIEPAPEEAAPIEARLVRGLAKLGERLIVLIDLPQALSLEPRGASA